MKPCTFMMRDLYVRDKVIFVDFDEMEKIILSTNQFFSVCSSDMTSFINNDLINLLKQGYAMLNIPVGKVVKTNKNISFVNIDLNSNRPARTV